MEEVRSVRRVFEQALGSARNDWLLGTVLTVVLAPLALAITGIVILVLLTGPDGWVRRATGHPTGVAAAVEVFLGLLFLAFVFGDGRRIAWRYVGGAAAGLVALACLAHLTPLPQAAPVAFWIVWSLGVFGVLALMGLAYDAKDHYDLGIGRWMVDDPFTLSDDLDRAHVALGFIVAIPRSMLGAVSDIVAGGWALRGLDGAEVEAASRVVLGIARTDPSLANDALRRLGPDSSARVLRALDGMKLVVPGDPPRLSAKGVKLVSTAMGASPGSSWRA